MRRPAWRVSFVQQHVSAWGVDAPAGEHAVPLYIRGQRGGCVRAYRVLVLLSFVRDRLGVDSRDVNWDSAIPALGASGAISGVMGAYAVLSETPDSDVLFYFFDTGAAILILGYWFVLQLWRGLMGWEWRRRGAVAWWRILGIFCGSGDCLGGEEEIKAKNGLNAESGTRRRGRREEGERIGSSVT